MGFSMQVLGMAAKGGGAYHQARAQRDAFHQQAFMDRNNAQVAEYQAERAEAVGAEQEETSRLKTAQVYSAQRAALGANGVDLGTGSATDILTTTDVMGTHDVLAIRSNAQFQAWGYRTAETNDLNLASMSDAAARDINPIMAGVGSALGGASGVSSSWQQGGSGAWYQGGGTDSSGYSNVPSWMVNF